MRWKTNHVVVRALVDDAIWLRPEPNQPEPTRRACQQGERHELAKVRRHGAALHATAVNLLDVDRGTGGWRVGRQFADDGWGGGVRVKLTSGSGGGPGRLRLQRCSRLLAATAMVGSVWVSMSEWESEWVSESKRVPTGDIQTTVLAVGLRARQERYQCWRVA
jgi:hypothetical protein